MWLNALCSLHFFNVCLRRIVEDLKLCLLEYSFELSYNLYWTRILFFYFLFDKLYVSVWEIVFLLIIRVLNKLFFFYIYYKNIWPSSAKDFCGLIHLFEFNLQLINLQIYYKNVTLYICWFSTSRLRTKKKNCSRESFERLMFLSCFFLDKNLPPGLVSIKNIILYTS